MALVREAGEHRALAGRAMPVEVPPSEGLGVIARSNAWERRVG